MQRIHTREEIEAQCVSDYEDVVGRVVLLDMVECHDADLAPVTLRCDPPAIARIEAYLDGSSDTRVLRWMDSECCDPVYMVSILEEHPVFVEAGVRPSWVYGMSRMTSGHIDLPAFVIADEATQELYRGATPVSYPEEMWSDRIPFVLGG